MVFMSGVFVRWSVHQRGVYWQVQRVETKTSVANCCYTPTTCADPSCVQPSALALVRLTGQVVTADDLPRLRSSGARTLGQQQ